MFKKKFALTLIALLLLAALLLTGCGKASSGDPADPTDPTDQHPKIVTYFFDYYVDGSWSGYSGPFEGASGEVISQLPTGCEMSPEYELKSSDLPYTLTENNSIKLYYETTDKLQIKTPGPISPSVLINRIDFYFSSRLTTIGLLRALELVTTAQVEHAHSGEYHLDSLKYYDTGVSVADFKSACLQYVSESYFDRNLDFSDNVDGAWFKVLDGKLLYAPPHTGWVIPSPKSVTYLKTAGKQYWYAVDAVREGDEEIGPPTTEHYKFAFVLENGNYVLGDVVLV